MLEKYSEIWNKIKSLNKKELNSEPVYNGKYIRTKIKFTMIKYMQIFKIIRYQKIMNIVPLDLQYY